MECNSEGTCLLKLFLPKFILLLFAFNSGIAKTDHQDLYDSSCEDTVEVLQVQTFIPIIKN